jgi:hypothetical protein
MANHPLQKNTIACTKITPQPIIEPRDTYLVRITAIRKTETAAGKKTGHTTIKNPRLQAIPFHL